MSKHQNGARSNPTQKAGNQIQPKYDEVARVAYELYERRNRQNGHDQEDWFEAEIIVKQGRK